jgi:hypothetical protein
MLPHRSPEGIRVLEIWMAVLQLVLALIGLAALRAWLRRAAGRARDRDPTAAALPYRRKDYLLSKAERSFYEVLLFALARRTDVAVFAKVRLLDLLWMPHGTRDRQAHRNRVVSKHVDFVLCDRAQRRPLLVIELDDASHEESSRRDRDAFVDAALRAAGLPVLHVRAARSYASSELARLVDQHLVGAAPAPSRSSD